MALANVILADPPVGSAAVVIAPDIAAAERLLRADLEKIGLPQDPLIALEMVPCPLDHPTVLILCDGDY